MAGTVDITAADLRKQAMDLRDFADNLESASTAAAHRDPYAYGAIGMAWAWRMNERFDSADRFTSEAAEAARRVADEMDRMADDFKQEDSTHAAGLKTIGGDLS